MKTAPLPDNESLRVMALERLGLLDTPPDAVFDNLAQAAASLCEVPIALICLVDPVRQWFKACVGLDVTETSRDVAFCAHAILRPNELLEVEDATRDERFHDNPLVAGNPDIRFYAGQPLLTADGLALGTLCVIDRKPRKLTQPQRDALRSIATAVTGLFEERRTSPSISFNRLLEKTVNCGIAISDASSPDFAISYCNLGFENLTGYHRDEILGKNCRILQGDDTDPADVQRIRDALDKQQDVTVTLKNYRKDGSGFWNELSLFGVRTNNSDGYQILGVQRDVTERRSVEQLGPDLDSIIDAPVNEVYIVDDETLQFVYVNQRGRDNLGYSIDELQKLTPIDMGSGLDRVKLDRTFQPLRDGLKPMLQFETKHTRKDGTSYQAEIQLQMAEFNSKRVIVAIALDLTTRLKAEDALLRSRLLLETEAALRNSEERYRDLFENAHDLVQNVLPDGTFAYVNPAWKRTLGYTDEEVASLKILDVIHPDHHAQCRVLFQRILSGENVGEVRVQFLTKKGETAFVKGRTSCRFDNGKPHSTRGIFHDITEHVLAERALKSARDDAERATATKSRFLAAASHDLRQPLQSIGLSFSSLEDQVTDPEVVSECGKIRGSLDSIGEILDVLLDVSQLDSGSVQPKRQNFMATDKLEVLVESHHAAAAAKGLDIRLEAEPVALYGDPALLMRILDNLVANSLRYTDQGEIVVRCISKGDIARIEVQDTGIGIPQDTQDAIFEEYYQLDNPTRDRSKGLGLGLSIVKHIALLLEHPIKVQSKLGEGAIFSLEMPIGQAHERTTQPNPGQGDAKLDVPTPPSRQPIVLFIDDYPDILSSAARMFRRWGVEAHMAQDGAEAIAHIENGIQPDIIISDYRLPGLNGLELIQKVREMTSPDLPAVLLTGDSFPDEVGGPDEAEIALLSKPVSSTKLRAIVEKVSAD